ncbi:MAG: hypothetical protein HRT77_14395 [Halioglobus sp.]|nr:hypothetical protein [Halioglobus sp.]
MCAGSTIADAQKKAVNTELIYRITHRAYLDPTSGLAQISIALDQDSHLVREVNFRMPPTHFMNIRSDAPLAIQGDKVSWQPGASGSTLNYDAVIAHRRDNGEMDAQITQHWALFKLDHLFPAATTRALKSAHADAQLVLSAPQGWRIETPYGSGADRAFAINNPERLFDQPRGWAMAGKLAIRRDNSSGHNVSVASPMGTHLRANDILSFLNWTVPSLLEVFPELPSRLLIVSGTQDMWRGGLSGRSSLYVHPDRPLVSGNRTSTLLHELVHVASRMRAKSGADWIVEGIAEYYSVELLYRSGGISKNRYDMAFNMLEKWSAGYPCAATDRSQGKRTAAAVGVMRALDQEIRRKTNNQASIDNLVRTVLAGSRTVSNHSFREAAQALIGGPVTALDGCP